LKNLTDSDKRWLNSIDSSRKEFAEKELIKEYKHNRNINSPKFNKRRDDKDAR